MAAGTISAISSESSSSESAPAARRPGSAARGARTPTPPPPQCIMRSAADAGDDYPGPPADAGRRPRRPLRAVAGLDLPQAQQRRPRHAAICPPPRRQALRNLGPARRRHPVRPRLPDAAERDGDRMRAPAFLVRADGTEQLFLAFGMLFAGLVFVPFGAALLLRLGRGMNEAAFGELGAWQETGFTILRSFFAVGAFLFALLGAAFLSIAILARSGLIKNPW